MSRHRRYEIQDKLGAGGMGAVYTARDRLTGKTLALKRVLLPPESMSDDRASDLLTAIATEFRTLAGLRHPHVIGVMDYGFILEGNNPQPYFTMEYLPGARNITQVAADESPEIQVRLLTEMLLALAYLHRRGVVHRDLKPDNVLVDSNGRVKVLDFGLALGVTGKSNTGFTEGTAGTMAYMAPELFAEETATPRSDLYAVGMLMYEVFTGHYPFNRKNLMLLLNDIMNSKPDVSRLEFNLGGLVAQLLTKDPAQRPVDANAVIQALCEATGQPLPSESLAVRESFLQASRFVGRAPEMEQLKTALDTVLKPGSAPEAQVYLIGGESGVGKSRLLDELRTRALVKGFVVLRGQGIAEGGLPYQLWREMARELALSTALSDLEAGILKAIVPDIGTLLNRDIADAPELTGGAGQQRLVLALVDLLKRQPEPILLLLEDLHWAQESLDALRQVLTVKEQLPRLLVLGTYRDDEHPTLPDELPGAQKLKLFRLEDTEIGELARSMLGETGTQPEVLDLLKRETEGNAFFMVETVRALAEEAGTLGDIGRSTLPRQVFAGGVQQIVRRRLSRVPDHVRPLLNQAAIAGRLLDLKVLQKLADTDLNGFLAAGANSGVLEIIEERWRFAHDKLRETILQDLSENERRDLHHAAASAIEAVYPDDASYHETLLEHWRIAGDPSKELQYLLSVVDSAIYVTADYARAVQLAERGLTLAGAEGANRPALLNFLSHVGLRRSDYNSAREWAQQARQAAEQLHDRHALADSLHNLALVADDLGNSIDAADFNHQSLAIRRDIGDQQGIAASLNSLGIMAVNQGNLPAAGDYLEQSLAIRRDIGDRMSIAASLQNLGGLTHMRGDYAAAKDYYQQTLGVRREVGDQYGLALTLYALGLVSIDLDDYPAAGDYLEQSLAIRRDIGDQQGISGCFEGLGRVAGAQGDYQTARDYFEQSLAVARAVGHPLSIANTLNNLGLTRMYQGDSAGAAASILEALRVSHNADIPSIMLDALVSLLRLRVQSGDPAYAAELTGLVDVHPAMYAGLRDDEFARLKRELEAVLPTDKLAAALERGKALDLDAVVQKLLAEN